MSIIFQVSYIRQGVNPPSADQIHFSGDFLTKGFKIGVVVGMVALTVSNKFNSTVYT